MTFYSTVLEEYFTGIFTLGAPNAVHDGSFALFAICGIGYYLGPQWWTAAGNFNIDFGFGQLKLVDEVVCFAICISIVASSTNFYTIIKDGLNKHKKKDMGTPFTWSHFLSLASFPLFMNGLFFWFGCTFYDILIKKYIVFFNFLHFFVNTNVINHMLVKHSTHNKFNPWAVSSFWIVNSVIFVCTLCQCCFKYDISMHIENIFFILLGIACFASVFFNCRVVYQIAAALKIKIFGINAPKRTSPRKKA